MENRKIYWVSEERLSEILKVTTRQIRSVCIGAKNKNRDSIYKGKYDLIIGVQLYVENIRTEKGDYQTEIKRIEKEHKQLKLDMARGKTVDTKQVEALVGDMIVKFKSKLSSIPSKLAMALVNKDNSSEIEKILRRELDEIQTELVDVEFEIYEEEEEENEDR